MEKHGILSKISMLIYKKLIYKKHEILFKTSTIILAFAFGLSIRHAQWTNVVVIILGWCCVYYFYKRRCGDTFKKEIDKIINTPISKGRNALK